MTAPRLKHRILVTGGSGFIGTNLVRFLSSRGELVLNASRRQPRDPEQWPLFTHVDVLDSALLTRTVREFSPDLVVHLAAKTGYAGEEDRRAYEINSVGTANVIQAVSCCGSVNRVIFASSNVVTRDLPDPGRDGRVPRFLYSDSKRATEEIIMRDRSMQCSWCIVRPCYVWGPWFDAPFKDFFLAIARGVYIQPGKAPIQKRLGYVGNMVHQIVALMDADAEAIHRKVLYLAEYESISIQSWAEMISAELGVRPPRAFPDSVVTMAAKAGDIIRALGYRDFPLSSRRLANMRLEADDVSIDAIQGIAGPLPFTTGEGIRETIDWMRRQGLLNKHS